MNPNRYQKTVLLVLFALTFIPKRYQFFLKICSCHNILNYIRITLTVVIFESNTIRGCRFQTMNFTLGATIIPVAFKLVPLAVGGGGGTTFWPNIEHKSGMVSYLFPQTTIYYEYV